MRSSQCKICKMFFVFFVFFLERVCFAVAHITDTALTRPLHEWSRCLCENPPVLWIFCRPRQLPAASHGRFSSDQNCSRRRRVNGALAQGCFLRGRIIHARHENGISNSSLRALRLDGCVCSNVFPRRWPSPPSILHNFTGKTSLLYTAVWPTAIGFSLLTSNVLHAMISLHCSTVSAHKYLKVQWENWRFLFQLTQLKICL